MLDFIKTFPRTFRDDESGAVTVDWVVLTAALVGLGIAVLGVVGGGIGTLSETIETDLGATATGTDISDS